MSSRPSDDWPTIDPDHLALPAARQRTLLALVARARRRRRSTSTPARDWDAGARTLLALPGIGPWTAEMIAMRGLGDPDAFPATDLGRAQVGGRQLGLPDDAEALSDTARRWRPWRSYATQYLWTALDHSVNHWPPEGERMTQLPHRSTARSGR